MKKNIIKFFLIISLSFFFSPLFVFAQEEKEAVTFIPQVTIPGSTFIASTSVVMGGSLSTIGEYIKAIYNYLILLVGLVAVIASMVGGVIWLTAAGNTAKISTAKSWIGGSLTGLVLALSAYLILKTINPNLTDFRDQNIASIGEITTGCCRIPKDVDTNGYLTGSSTRRLTRDLTATQCYLRAVELKEPGLKTLDELKEDKKYEKMNDNEIIEKYLGSLQNGPSTGWFLPKYTSVNFIGCETVGACFIGEVGGTATIYNKEKKDYTTYLAHCFSSTQVQCKNLQNYLEKEEWGDQDMGSPKQKEKPFYVFSNSYQGCSNDFVKNVVLKNLPQYVLDEASAQKKPYTQENIKILKPNDESDEDWYKGGHMMYWFKNNLWYHGLGTSGEPCGNEGGICVPSGNSCKEIKTGGNRDYGGRSCIDGYKCCKEI